LISAGGFNSEVAGEGRAGGEGLKLGRREEARDLGALRVGPAGEGERVSREEMTGARESCGAADGMGGSSGPNMLGFRCKFIGRGLVFVLLPLSGERIFSFLSFDVLSRFSVFASLGVEAFNSVNLEAVLRLMVIGE
jgi:hypothetical protein